MSLLSKPWIYPVKTRLPSKLYLVKWQDLPSQFPIYSVNSHFYSVNPRIYQVNPGFTGSIILTWSIPYLLSQYPDLLSQSVILLGQSSEFTQSILNLPSQFSRFTQSILLGQLSLLGQFGFYSVNPQIYSVNSWDLLGKSDLLSQFYLVNSYRGGVQQ